MPLSNDVELGEKPPESCSAQAESCETWWLSTQRRGVSKARGYKQKERRGGNSLKFTISSLHINKCIIMCRWGFVFGLISWKVSDLPMPLDLGWAIAHLLEAILQQHWLVPEATELLIRQESHLQETNRERVTTHPCDHVHFIDKHTRDTLPNTYIHEPSKKGFLIHFSTQLHIFAQKTWDQKWVPDKKRTVRFHSTTTICH